MLGYVIFVPVWALLLALWVATLAGAARGYFLGKRAADAGRPASMTINLRLASR